MSKLHRTTIILFLAPVLAGCVSYWDEPLPVPARDRVLATRTDAAGVRETYILKVPGLGDATLRVETDSPREGAYLGLAVEELERESAEDRGVKPFSGLLVTDVLFGSGAAAGGVEVGDVLLSLGGKATVYAQQIGKAEATLQPGQRVDARVLRGQTEMDLSIEARLHVHRDERTTLVPLEQAHAPGRPCAGASLRGIPAEWCQKIWGDRRQAVVVTNVLPGSPAWLAGVRGGDLVESVDGAPVPAVADLVQQIADRGARREAMQWHVRSGDDEHDATIALRDYSGETNVWIPLIFRLADGVQTDTWTVGPLGMLMRHNGEYVANPRTRAVQTHEEFSALLGLFHVESSPNEARLRLLWVISIPL